MTQILPGGVVPLAVAAGAPRPAAPASQAWLLQLERARWQDQPRYGPLAGLPDEGIAPEGDQAGGGMPTPASHASVDVSEDATGSRTMEAAGGAAITPSEVDLLAMAPTRGSRTPAAAGWAATQAVLAQRDRLQAQAVRAALGAQRGGPGEPLADWAERHVHVQVAADHWAVWIRDAAVTQERVQDVLRTLEQLAGEGELRRPVRLTVNGQPVPRADAGTPHRIETQGEAHGD